MNKILFFAQLRERLECDELDLDVAGLSVGELRQQLAQKNKRWQKWLLDKDVLVAVNQALVAADSRIGEGDEVAMFPPVTGG
ncbi:molybdopterin converting factor subunit 1 [Pseudoalteromonas sp. OOF1S-7]|uniref:molybdopterin converting factor subunit 1 n=1 Tax=Pseudoalteromonas sp. OOF1S-7 TaxID=2917757 RepID=UPI001EF6A137|nr:molybdopterin converting factor subunit 1 [Pseudoalteromonas sp. OOF1S-7]MCG7533470.1 molybdopterin converting factor subunit 1 [Pseudoalteromonas sp. OOF1S-7]